MNLRALSAAPLAAFVATTSGGGHGPAPCGTARPERQTVHLALKSGNFGGPDFFLDTTQTA